jgi:hypothetical protein
MMEGEVWEIGVANAKDIAERLKELLTLYDKGLGGMVIVEVDIHLLGEVPGQVQLTQTHTFAVGDVYEMLPEDEDPQVPEWKVNDIRAHLVKKE